MKFAHVLLAVVAGLFIAGAGAQPLPLKLQPKKASERVCYFEGEPALASSANRAFNSNASFIVTNDGVVVFDALGTPALGAAMKAAIASVTRQPIRLVIVSHFHADHFYGLQALVGPGVEVWAHANGRETLGSPVAQDRLEQRRRDLWPDVDQTRIWWAPRAGLTSRRRRKCRSTAAGSAFG